MSVPEMDSLTLIRQVIQKYCDAPPESIVPEATLEDLNVDSLSLAEMLFALEDTLGTSIAEPTERPRTVADLQKLITQHVNDSDSPTYRGDQWVKAEVRVYPSGDVEHLIEGKVVLKYSGIQFDPNDADAKPLIKGSDLMIKSGWISLQSESHPCEFRNIEIRKLD